MTRRYVPLLILLLVSCGSMGYKPSLSHMRVDLLYAKLAKEKNIEMRWQLAGDFYASLSKRGYPFVEDGRVHIFYWDQQGRSFSLVGDFNDWLPGGVRFKRLFGTPLLHVALSANKYSRIRYKIASGKFWTYDRHNKRYISDGSGGKISLYERLRSQLPEWAFLRSSVVPGQLRHFRFVSTRYRSARTISVYLPRYIDVKQPFKLCFVQYRFQKQFLSIYKNILDNIFAKKRYPAVAFLFVPAAKNGSEFPSRGFDFIDILYRELLPKIDEFIPGFVTATKKEVLSILLFGRGAGLYMLSLAKGNSYFSDVYLVRPELGEYRNLIRYFIRYGKKYDYSGVTLLIQDNRNEPQEISSMFAKYKAVYQYLALPKVAETSYQRIALFRYHIERMLNMITK